MVSARYICFFALALCSLLCLLTACGTDPTVTPAVASPVANADPDPTETASNLNSPVFLVPTAAPTSTSQITDGATAIATVTAEATDDAATDTPTADDSDTASPDATQNGGRATRVRTPRLPKPTHTPKPKAEPTSTHTPKPTKTPKPTSTPKPTKTSRPDPTDTPIPATSTPDSRPPSELSAAGQLTYAAPGCTIKGNVSSDGKIYHLPGQSGYDRIVINPNKGERWFCTEADAVANGWRKAKR